MQWLEGMAWQNDLHSIVSYVSHYCCSAQWTAESTYMYSAVNVVNCLPVTIS